MPDPYDQQDPPSGSNHGSAGSRVNSKFLAALVCGAVIALAAVWIYDRFSAHARPESKAVSLEMATRAIADDSGTGARAEQPGIAERSDADRPKNIILFIADGMGFAHLSAARTVLHGIDGQAEWDRFPVTGWQRTHPAVGFLTDSAASATAMATGVPTSNGTLGMDDAGRDQVTLFERATELGYRTGLVTDSYIWDATPAAFASHVASRDEAESILRQMTHASLDVLFGELEDVGEGDVPEWQESVEILEQRFQVFGPEAPDFPLDADPATPVAAIFEQDAVDDLDDAPNLPSLVREALERLSSDERPFVLMVESEEGDSASHRSDFPRLIRGMAAIEASLEVVLDFAAERGDTLVVFTGDHETGGLALTVEETNLNLKPIWPTRGHTGVSIPVLAFGPGSEPFGGIHANWQLGRLLATSLQTTDTTADSERIGLDSDASAPTG